MAKSKQQHGDFFIGAFPSTRERSSSDTPFSLASLGDRLNSRSGPSVGQAAAASHRHPGAPGTMAPVNEKYRPCGSRQAHPVCLAAEMSASDLVIAGLQGQWRGRLSGELRGRASQRSGGLWRRHPRKRCRDGRLYFRSRACPAGSGYATTAIVISKMTVGGVNETTRHRAGRRAIFRETGRGSIGCCSRGERTQPI